MAAAGARGQTAEEIRALLDTYDARALDVLLQKAKSSPNEQKTQQQGKDHPPSVTVDLANAAWVAKGVNCAPAYEQALRQLGGAGCEPLDFRGDPRQAASRINDWVSNATYGRIPALFPPGSAADPQTRLLLTNAIYFRGAWQHPFSEKRTRNGSFSTTPDRKTTARFMNQVERFPYAQTDQAQTIELPFAGGEWSMLVVLPAPSIPVEKIGEQLAAEGIKATTSRLEPAEVELTLPRFTFQTRAELAPVLARIGMPSAFDPARADFSAAMTDSAQRLVISSVLHQAMIRVDEIGSEAAAVTAITITPTSVQRPGDTKVFRADRPFLFAIVHKPSQTPIFLGRLSEPPPEPAAAGKQAP
jgi:serpin B